MKKINTFHRYLLMLVACLMLATPSADATDQSRKPVSVNPAQMYQRGDSLYINMDIHYGSIHLDRDRELTLTPVLSNGTDSLELPSVLINGKIRHKAYKRSLALHHTQDMSYKTVAEYKKDASLPVQYVITVPFEGWMRSASLNLREDYCGCGRHHEEMYANRIIDKVALEEIPRPVLAYIRPAGQEIKERSLQLDLFLDFPVSKTEIIPGYMNNEGELQKLEKMFKELQQDRNITVTHIQIAGYASPEGSVAFNKQLSEGRANALRKYLTSEKYFNENLYTVRYDGENWEGLTKVLTNSSLAYSNQVLLIINSTSDVNQRKEAIKKLEGGAPYREMLKEIYPKLRKVVCHVDLQIRKFTVEEGKEILKTNPSYLNLDEMYRIANTYPEGTDDFIRVFAIAAEQSPNDSIANLNLAAAALSREDPQRAIMNLNKSDSSTPEYLNNMGVYYMQTDEPEKARNFFEQAIYKGFEMAEKNMEILKMKYPKLQ